MNNILHNNVEDFIASLKDDSEFVPFAYYDKHMDCIRVQIRDCSFKEERKNKIITVLKANHIGQDKPIGFNIKGVRYVFEEIGLPLSGVHKLADLIDRMAKWFPDLAINQVKDDFRPILQKQNLSVELS